MKALLSVRGFFEANADPRRDISHGVVQRPDQVAFGVRAAQQMSVHKTDSACQQPMLTGEGEHHAVVLRRLANQLPEITVKFLSAVGQLRELELGQDVGVDLHSVALQQFDELRHRRTSPQKSYPDTRRNADQHVAYRRRRAEGGEEGPPPYIEAKRLAALTSIRVRRALSMTKVFVNTGTPSLASRCAWAKASVASRSKVSSKSSVVLIAYNMLPSICMGQG